MALGAERLAEILAEVADTRVDLKRRLRMELAAQEGPGPLAVEIDKRLTAFETSRGQITWRARPAFIRDLDALRDLIVTRLAPLDTSAAIERLWRFMDTATQAARRYRDRNGEMEDVYAHVAADLGGLLDRAAPGPAAAALVESLTRNVSGWKAWLPSLLAHAPRAIAEDGLRFMAERRGAVPGWITLIRALADAAGDLEAFRATYSADALKSPPIAVELARRYLVADQVEAAGAILRAAAPTVGSRGKTPAPDFDWESLWIDYLERAGREEEAQAVRWASFERTLSPDRAHAFVGRLGDFDDVEAEGQAFAVAAKAKDVEAGLGFLMGWPALPEASRMIEARREEIQLAPETAELWAAKLRRRYPQAAHTLLRRAAAAAFRRCDFKSCDRLTAEAETIAP
ncbi:MAG: hypothetical protein JO303_09565 [Caulobacteraceae bacterium]|nr:hypothetical protein [Caulobacteraceae bacterium]